MDSHRPPGGYVVPSGLTHREALEQLFVEIAGSFQPFHWDKRIRDALDAAAKTIGKKRVTELFEQHPNNPDRKAEAGVSSA